MSTSSQEGHLPDQVNKSSLSRGNGNGNMMMMHIEEPTSHNDIISSSGPTTSRRSLEDQRPHKKEVIRYRECQKNHAAAIGGNATDGCGEFMPGGGEEEGTVQEALKCSACNCHRNFHRKEVEGDEFPSECFRSRLLLLNNNIAGRQLKSTGVVGPEIVGYPTGTLISSATAPHQYHQMIMPYKMGFSHSQSDHEQEDRGGTRLPAGDGAAVKKRRFRTKFSQEQKEKMLSFAEKAGWKIQKLEESVVQHFCQEIGIKRRVLKVWMHNNKHNNLAKKTTSSTST